jgi:serine phosphatase RsbU (regulator of sigma subunit)
LLLRRDTETPEPLPPVGLAVGMMAEQAYQARCTHLNAGDSLLVFSDGLPEALNPQGIAFGENRVVAALKSAGLRSAVRSPEALLTKLSADLSQHMGDRPPHDDVTMLHLFAAPAPLQPDKTNR